MTFIVREMQLGDVPACVAIINHTIALGNTTAHETPYTAEAFEYFTDPDFVNVVLHDNRIVGFQAVFKVDTGVYSVGSFTDQQNPVRGAGAALMEQMKNDCRAAGGTSIIAKITEDNTGGLAYYSKMGFQPDSILPADHTRPDGTTVDRIIKRFML